jgi:diguanylate cyclase (GGDEF)-like protein
MIKAKLFALVIPLATFTAGVMLLPFVDDLPAGLELIRHYAAYPIILTCLALSFSFNQSRLFFVLYVTAIFYALVLGDLVPPQLFQPFDEFRFIQLVFLLYLLAVLFFLFLQERGVITVQGILRLALCSALPLLPLYLAGEQSVLSMGWLSMAVFPEEVSQRLPLPDIIVAFYVIVIWVVLGKMLYRPGLVETGYFSLLAGAGIALYYYPEIARVQFMFTLALTVVLFFILRNSFQLAYQDELTGLSGRRALKEQMRKLGSTFSIAMMDIDHFKKFNDRYGHDVGDEVLKMVAGHIRKTGNGGKAFRYGGEEFTLVFPGKNIEDVIPSLEKLRSEIADTRFYVRGSNRPQSKESGLKMRKGKPAGRSRDIHVTISIGVSDSERSGNSPDEVIKVADKALYRAKKKGRNQVSK